MVGLLLRSLAYWRSPEKMQPRHAHPRPHGACRLAHRHHARLAQAPTATGWEGALASAGSTVSPRAAARPRHWGPGAVSLGAPRSGQRAVPCPSSARQAPGGRTRFGGAKGSPGAQSRVSRHRPRRTGRGGLLWPCGGRQGWRRTVTGRPGHPRQGSAPQHGAGGDGPQRTLGGRRGSVPCGPRLSLGVRLLPGWSSAP
jgi:hypothetical protein